MIERRSTPSYRDLIQSIDIVCGVTRSSGAAFGHLPKVQVRIDVHREASTTAYLLNQSVIFEMAREISVD